MAQNNIEKKDQAQRQFISKTEFRLSLEAVSIGITLLCVGSILSWFADASLFGSLMHLASGDILRMDSTVAYLHVFGGSSGIIGTFTLGLGFCKLFKSLAAADTTEGSTEQD